MLKEAYLKTVRYNQLRIKRKEMKAKSQIKISHKIVYNRVADNKTKE